MSFNEIAIKVKNLSKRYEIYSEPRDRLKQFVAPRIQRAMGMPVKQYFNEFWAVKNVSFEVRKGETVGILGRNGSGKSTLLQMICGTLTPTGGEIETNGRIAALLELGSGFNPEFTGRENVYLNASVLGLTNNEIDKRFDDIAAFADIGNFINQPVKIYSSGMFVRLAFAVIAHVDADILVIDEALAVGDAIFTQKCMQYIRQFRERGTLLFVSHDIGSVQNLCETGMWLGYGETKMIGPSKDVAEAYLKYTKQETYGSSVQLSDAENKKSSALGEKEISENIKLEKTISLNNKSNIAIKNNLDDAKGWQTGEAEIILINLAVIQEEETNGVFVGGEKVRLTVKAIVHKHLDNPIIGFTVRDRLGQELFGENTLPFTEINSISAKKNEEITAEFDFQMPMLPNGTYAVMASIANGTLYDHVQHHFLHDALIIEVSSSKIRWGLVGIQFDNVKLSKLNEK